MMADAVTADGTTVGDADRLPWLEAVEDEDEKRGPSAAKLIGALLIGLIAIAAVIYALFSLGNRDGGETREAEMIAPPSPDYKERPADAGGMKVEGEGDTAFAASEGADPDGRIDLDAIPEAPVAGARGIAPAEQLTTKPGAPAAEKPVVAPAPAPKVEPARQPTIVPAAGGAQVQLGAFSSNAGAQAAWKSMSGRFVSLKPLANSVVLASVGGKTVYRLRASVGSQADARTLCGKLKVAGESCTVIG